MPDRGVDSECRWDGRPRRENKKYGGILGILLAKNGDVDSFIDSKQGGPAHLLRQPILHSLSLSHSLTVEAFETETKTGRTTS